MIRAIVAIDTKLGIANETGIPWRLPADKQYFRDKTHGGLVLMGFNSYQQFEKPLEGRDNFVIVRPGTKLRSGFVGVEDVSEFLKLHQNEELWIIGGAAVFAQTIDHVREIYLTQLESDFHCTKFFPDFHDQFLLKSKSQNQVQNGISFRFEVWERQQ